MAKNETYVSSKSGRVGKWFINVWATLTMFYLFLPIFVIVVFSFNDPVSKNNFTWSGVTLKHWRKTIFGGEPDRYFFPELNEALIRSIYIGAITAIVATALGTLMALALTRYKPKRSGALSTLLVLPLTTPEIVLGASLFTLFLDFSLNLGASQFTIPFGPIAIVLAHVMFCMSYVTLTIKARMRGFPWMLEDAAQDLGATPRKAFWKVTLPLILPGVFAAALLSFALSFDDFIITLFTNGDFETFPVRVYNQSRTSVPPQVNILSTILLVVTTVLFIVPTLISIRKSKKAGILAK